ncbi:MAG: hypothetical protein JWP00_4602 [Chloroflexi bacterium]|nr:hypothetical protein [Chloroflexota bacterium]
MKRYFPGQGWSRKHLLIFTGSFIFLLFSFFSLVAVPATRAAVTVGTGTSASCTEDSLVAALAAGGHITFNCGAGKATIPISSRKNIAVDTILDGTGASITLDGNAGTQTTTGMFFINSSKALTVTNLSLINGKSNDNGGAIYAFNQSKLAVINSTFNNNISLIGDNHEGGGAIFLGPDATGTITNSLFTYNQAPSGGAITSRDTTSLTISGSNFTGNIATASDGGAIYSHTLLENPHSFTIEASKVLSNVAKIQGGGISIAYLKAIQSVTINQTEIAYNNFGKTPVTGRGGGIYVEQGQLTLNASILHSNVVPQDGGGLFIGQDTQVSPFVTINNSTIANNQANNNNGGGGSGGGIYRKSGSLHLNHLTIYGNYSHGPGGGLNTATVGLNLPDSSNVVLTNSIITANTSKENYFSDCADSVKNGSYNLQFTPSDPYSQVCVTGITRADPRLAPLQNVGGPTPIFGLLAGSPAIDVIPAVNCPLNQDQRGVTRPGVASPVNSNCDIGAFEGTINPPDLAMAFNPSTVGLGGTSTLTFTVRNTSTIGTPLTGIAFMSNLSANLKVADSPNLLANCAGPQGKPSVLFTNNGSTINIVNASLTVGQVCTISVDVVNQLTSPGTLTAQVVLISYLINVNHLSNAQATLKVVDTSPRGLAAVAISSSQIHLSWQSVPGSPSSIRIERSVNGTANFQLLTNVGAGVTTYDNTGLSDGTLYYYQISAVLPGGNSPYSNHSWATTMLSAPVNLTAIIVGSNKINLRWQNTSGKQAGFKLERKAGQAGTYGPVPGSPVAGTTYQYLDTALTPGIIYFYRVQAINADPALDSAYSNEVSLKSTGIQLVTSPDEKGSGEPGTLKHALEQAATTADKAIIFDLTSGTTLTVETWVTLTIAEGVTISGSCTGGPGITIKGASFQLFGNVTLYGIRITGPRPAGAGPLITNKLSDASIKTGNRLSCVSVGP